MNRRNLRCRVSVLLITRDMPGVSERGEDLGSLPRGTNARAHVNTWVRSPHVPSDNKRPSSRDNELYQIL